jgi:uncharacterized C2H2 Zn-finger protein
MSFDPPSGRMRPQDIELANLIREVLNTAERKAKLILIKKLAATAHTAGRVPGVFNELVMSGPGGAHPALEFLAWLPDPMPMNLAVSVMPVLRVREVPMTLRIAVAGRLLAVVPDDPQTVSPIVQALSVGLSKMETLERLLELQRYVNRCETLDVMVEAAEAKTALRCPRCEERFTRSQLIAHLWKKHRLVFVDGQAVEPRALLEPVLMTAATGQDLPALDASFAMAAHYYPDENSVTTFQVLASRGTPEAAEVEQLLSAAEAKREGLCPVCLHAVPDPIPELAPEAALGSGRIFAEGYAVEVSDTGAGRIATLTRPGEETESLTQFGPSYPPRLIGVFAALLVFLLGFVAVLFVPARIVSPVIVGSIVLLAMWLAYLFARYLRKPLPDATDRALALVWSNLTPGIGRSAEAIRFLTRLCRTSLRAGDPVERSPAVYEIVEHAAVLADRAPENWQLLASVRVLQALDGSTMGREVVAGLTKVFTPFVKGELSPVYGEAAAQLVSAIGEAKPGEFARLAVMILDEAFHAGLSATDLATITRFLPHFKQQLLGALPDYLRLLQIIHANPDGELWAKLGSATTIFELAKNSPVESRKLLAVHPDALLILEVGDTIEAETGLIVLTARGLVVGPVLLSDPDTPIDMAKAGNGLWRLQMGTNRLPLNQKLPDRLPVLLKAWLRFRTATLLPLAERDDARVPSALAVAILSPLVVACPLCNTESLHRTGRIGTPWQAIQPS